MDKLILILILTGIVGGQLVQLPIFGLSIPLIDIAIILSFFLLLTRIKSMSGLFRLTSFRWFLGFIALLLVSLGVNMGGFSFHEIATAGAYLARLALYGLVGFMLWPTLTQKNMTFYLSALGLAFSAFVAISFFVFGLFPNFEIFDYLEWDPHRFRLVGTFFDPNYSSVLLGFGITLSILVLLQLGMKNWQWILALALNFGALMATTSRTGLVALVVGVSTLIIFIRSRWAWAFLIILVTSALLIPSVQSRLKHAFTDDSLRHRQESWTEGWQLTTENPVFGVGYNLLPNIRQETVLNPKLLGSHTISGFDSSLLTISATSGFTGLILFLLFVISLCLNALNNIFKRQNIFSRWFLISTVSLGVASIFINAWLYPPLLACWFLMMSLSLLETKR